MGVGNSQGAQPKFRLGILIVDDSEEVRRDLRTVLQLMPDLEVLGEAADGIEAVNLAEALRPDIVLMDLRLPGLDGFGATEQIKRRGLAKGVLMLTIYDEPQNRARAESVGVDLFIEKGSGIELLVSAIRQVGKTFVQHADGLPVCL